MQKLKSLAELLNISHIAADCFGKSKHFLYHKIKGSIVNGKPAEFNDAERQQLAAYLRKKAEEIKAAAADLEANP